VSDQEAIFVEHDGKIPRRFTLTIDPALARRAENWRREMGIGTMAEAVRALMRVALASMPADGLIEARQIEAFNQVRHWSQTRLAQTLREMADQLSEAAGIGTLGGSLIGR